MIKRFADKRPEASAVFGYGSGVFDQGVSIGKPQTDVIFVVEDIKKWHQDNMSENSGDYSFIGRRHFSTDDIDRIKGKNNITYVSDIRDNEAENLFKYGVVEKDDFQRSLSTWDNMFLVGRFHKPILEVISDEILSDVIASNREKAFRIACILSDPITNKEAIFKMLCGLSYLGDMRMKYAENPNKVKNIVNSNFFYLEKIYSFDKSYISFIGDDVIFISHEQLLLEILELPDCLVDYLAEYNTDIRNLEEVRSRILEYIVNHNSIESKAQIFEGIKTNGIVKSIPYALCKVRKKINK